MESIKILLLIDGIFPQPSLEIIAYYTSAVCHQLCGIIGAADVKQTLI
jgi:hypothetical protein